MLIGNVKTGIDVTHQSSDGTIDFAVRVDDTTIAIAGNNLKVKDGSIGTTQLSAAAVTTA